MQVLVTGGAGFIGSHLVDALIERGDQVTVIDDFSSGSKSNLRVSDRLTVKEFRLGRKIPADLPEGVFDAVVHLAGLPSVTASWADAAEAHERNLSATVSLLEACSTLAIPRFIFASSAAVYGLPVSLPVHETADCRPLSPYGLQKLTCEKYLELFAKQHGLCGIALRLFNVYGPRQRPDSSYSGAISIFSETLRRGEALTVYGDGTQTRDFVFVADVVEAMCAALTVPMKPGATLTLNIGTGVRSSLLELIETLSRVSGREMPAINFEKGRAGDIPHSQPDIAAATEHLNFCPRFSLADGLRALFAVR